MRTSELPAVVLERYSTRQSVCFCGGGVYSCTTSRIQL
jgi:hypothetical protein